jgi:hypothetical protein
LRRSLLAFAVVIVSARVAPGAIDRSYRSLEMREKLPKILTLPINSNL